MLKLILKIAFSIAGFALLGLVISGTKEPELKLYLAAVAAFGCLVMAAVDLWELICERREKSRDKKLIRSRIHDNLLSDRQKLEVLIPILEDEANTKTIDSSHELDSSTEALTDHLYSLISTAANKIKNEEEVKVIENWLNLRKRINHQLSQNSRTNFINEHRAAIESALNKLIEIYA